MAAITSLLPANNNGPCLCQQIGTYMGRQVTEFLLGECTAGSYHLGNPADSLDTNDACGQQFTSLGLSYTANFVALGGTITGSGSIFMLEDASSTVTVTAVSTTPNAAFGGGTHSPTVIPVNAASLSYFLNIATTVSVSGPASTSMPAMTNSSAAAISTTAINGMTSISSAGTVATSTSAMNGAPNGSSPFLGTLLLAWSVVGWLF